MKFGNEITYRLTSATDYTKLLDVTGVPFFDKCHVVEISKMVR